MFAFRLVRQQAETRRQEARRTILDAEAQLLQQTAATSTFDYLRSQVEDALKSRTDVNTGDKNGDNNGNSEDLERLVAKQRHEIEVCPHVFCGLILSVTCCCLPLTLTLTLTLTE